MTSTTAATSKRWVSRAGLICAVTGNRIPRHRGSLSRHIGSSLCMGSRHGKVDSSMQTQRNGESRRGRPLAAFARSPCISVDMERPVKITFGVVRHT